MRQRRSRELDARITETGWRLVGRVASIQPEPEILQVGDDAGCVYATRMRIRPWLGTGRPLGTTLEVLGSALSRDYPDLPALSAHGSFVRPASRFQGVRWETDGKPGAWMGELHWRYPHPVVRGVACLAHVVLVEQEKALTMTVRVFVDGGTAAVRGSAGVCQARPPFMPALHHAMRLDSDWGEAASRVLTAESVPAFVMDTLLRESRDYPVAVLAPLDDGSYVLPPEELATELLGIAPLFVIDRHPTTFRLTDLLGDKRLSCFWGALRIYQPDFSCASPSEEHPLLLRDRLVDPFQRAELIGRLAIGTRARVSPPPSVAARHAQTTKASRRDDAFNGHAKASSVDLPTGDVRQPAPDASPVPTVHVDGLMTALGTLSTEVRSLAAAVQQLATANRDLHQEVAQLRTAAAVRAGGAGSVERRIARIDRNLDQLRSLIGTGTESTFTESPESTAPDPDSADDEHATLQQIVQHASSTHADALLVLDSAERSAVDSPFEDVDRVATVLDAMAEVARRRQRGGLGMSIRDAFREYGIDYRGATAPSTSDKLRTQYQLLGPDGTTFDCQEHIVLGSTYDPRYCLRIYFTSRASLEPRFVVGHIGRHFDVKSTS